MTGPQQPQYGVPVPVESDRLPRRRVAQHAPMWWLGVHGGAGETTLARLTSWTAAADHAWPELVTTESLHRVRVVLVARTHASGLRSAQLAATEWASGAVQNVDLLGLVLVADAPGRLPRPLKDMAKIVTGGVPRTWRVPWIEAWRLGEEPNLDSSPRAVRAMVSDLNALLQ
ncbi:DUF6668 family protein [Nocardiopsis rhodophaea]